jgi:hypothetical protein
MKLSSLFWFVSLWCCCSFRFNQFWFCRIYFLLAE